jgi:hypothetical protein
MFEVTRIVSWWVHQDSNLGPAGYEPVALTAELWTRTRDSSKTRRRVDGKLGVGRGSGVAGSGVVCRGSYVGGVCPGSVSADRGSGDRGLRLPTPDSRKLNVQVRVGTTSTLPHLTPHSPPPTESLPDRRSSSNTASPRFCRLRCAYSSSGCRLRRGPDAVRRVRRCRGRR